MKSLFYVKNMLINPYVSLHNIFIYITLKHILKLLINMNVHLLTSILFHFVAFRCVLLRFVAFRCIIILKWWHFCCISTMLSPLHHTMCLQACHITPFKPWNKVRNNIYIYIYIYLSVRGNTYVKEIKVGSSLRFPVISSIFHVRDSINQFPYIPDIILHQQVSKYLLTKL